MPNATTTPLDPPGEAPPRGGRPRWGARLLGALLLPILYYGAYLLLRGPLPAEPQLIAHRGGAALAPENTLAAFRRAVVAGADALEFDVRRSADGVLVVVHDATLERTTDGRGAVAERTLAELRALDAGAGERIPTLEEVVRLAQATGVAVLPEAKAAEPGIGAQLASELAALGYAGNARIQSFRSEALLEARDAWAGADVCPLYGLWELDLSAPVPNDAAALCPMAEMVLLYPWMVRRAHADGRRVLVWFGAVEHPLTMRALLALGVDGLMVDDPAALAQVLGRR